MLEPIVDMEWVTTPSNRSIVFLVDLETCERFYFEKVYSKIIDTTTAP